MLQTGRRLAPEEYRVFFSEIAIYLSACGLAQLQGKEKAVWITGCFSIIKLQGARSYRCVPILATIITKCPKESQGQLPENVPNVILRILNPALEPFNIPTPSPDCYLSPAHGTSTFSFFPYLPQNMGQGNMKLTHTTHTSQR